MNLLTPFIVLIERRRWRNAAGLLLALLPTVFALRPVDAAPLLERGGKVDRDLSEELCGARLPRARWARDVDGVRHVQAVIVTSSTDPQMTDLRAHVEKLGRASPGYILSEGFVLREGYSLNEGFLLRESADPASGADDSMFGE